MRLIVQPVSSEASLTFCPLRPIAIARFSSSTTTSMACLSSSTRIEDTSAGASAPITNCAGSSDHNTMSTRSPASSCVTACTLAPRMPTHVPIGSMRLSLECTAIFARMPGSRAADLISSSPSSISGTSSRNSSMMNSGAVRREHQLRPAHIAVDAHDKGAHAVAYPQILLGDHLVARQHRFDAPDFDDRVAALDALDRAVDQFSPRPRKSFSSCSRSASRILCRITCFAVARRCGRKSIGSRASSI